jgi:peroxiredoxin
MKKLNHKWLYYTIGFIIIALLIISNIHFYNRSNFLYERIRILENRLTAEMERNIGIAVGENVEKYNIRTIDEKNISLIPSKGRYSVIIFFKDCDPCIEQIADIEEMNKNEEISPNIDIVAVTADKKEVVKRLISEQNITIPISTNASELIDKFAVNQYPFTYVINEYGLVELRMPGFEKSNVVYKTIKELINKGQI